MLQCLWHEGQHGFAAGEPSQGEAEELPAKDSPQTTPTAPGCFGGSIVQTVGVMTTVGGFVDVTFPFAGNRVSQGYF